MFKCEELICCNVHHQWIKKCLINDCKEVKDAYLLPILVFKPLKVAG